MENAFKKPTNYFFIERPLKSPASCWIIEKHFKIFTIKLYKL